MIGVWPHCGHDSPQLDNQDRLALSLEIVILAAGKGTRMHSAMPKVLHHIGGRTLLSHVLDTAVALQPAALHVIYGHGGEALPLAFSEVSHSPEINWIKQEQQLGTGHALSLALPEVNRDAEVLVLYGDVPLVAPKTLTPLVEASRSGGLGVLTAEVGSPEGYGRVVVDGAGNINRIVEERDATPAERMITEINTGFMAAPAACFARWLQQLTRNNAQGEYYLTDVVALATTAGVTVTASHADVACDVLGVNSRGDLARLERRYQRLAAESLMKDGVTLLDPDRFDLRGVLTAGTDCTIDINVIVEGEVTLGDRVQVGPNTVLKNCRIGSDSVIEAYCLVDETVIEARCQVGPFARLRPGVHLKEGSKVGNFVEAKKTTLGEGSKANHLAYLGDTEVGRNVNIGAGVITCNYDGANKHRTVIGDNAFIGSDCQLVAPVEVGADATIGAGSTISKDAPEGKLTLSRGRQSTIKGWKRPKKNDE